MVAVEGCVPGLLGGHDFRGKAKAKNRTWHGGEVRGYMPEIAGACCYKYPVDPAQLRLTRKLSGLAPLLLQTVAAVSSFLFLPHSSAVSICGSVLRIAKMLCALHQGTSFPVSLREEVQFQVRVIRTMTDGRNRSTCSFSADPDSCYVSDKAFPV